MASIYRSDLLAGREVVAAPVGPVEEHHRGLGAEREEGRPVEARAERAAVAREHHRAHAVLVGEAIARRDEGLEHREVEPVALLRAVEPHVRDVLIDGHEDAFAVHARNGTRRRPRRGAAVHFRRARAARTT